MLKDNLPARSRLTCLRDENDEPIWGLVEKDLLELALTHRSYAHEKQTEGNNERLEFLGDAVLQIIVTEYLYEHYADQEGELAKMRSSVVSQKPLAEVARKIGLGKHLLLGQGEVRNQGANKDSILSDALEALIGATYLSVGLEKTRVLVLEMLADLLEQAKTLGASLDWKGNLRKFLQENHLGDYYFTYEIQGPDHDRTFIAFCHIGSKDEESEETEATIVAKAKGASKKIAENQAAKLALGKLQKSMNRTNEFSS